MSEKKSKIKKKAVAAATAKIKELLALPEFHLEKLLDAIQKLVDLAPGGVVQLIIDLFCGAGGTSDGIEKAKHNKKKCAIIIAGINHDRKAIYSQAINHPLAYYSTEDIRFADLQPVLDIVAICRKRWPQCPIFVWASLDCTNHSNAKGGVSRDADSRTLAWHLNRYIEQINPDGLWIENVKEFAEWGPMMEKTIIQPKKGKKYTLQNLPKPENEAEFYRQKINEGCIAYCPLTKIKENKKWIGLGSTNIPIKDLKGTYYLPWRDSINAYGYYSSERILNAADYGVPQNRKRFFLLFMRNGWPIIFPEATHSKKPVNDIFNNLSPHVPVKTCLDFTQEGESIFTIKSNGERKIKSDKSFERYYAGLIKFVAGGKKEFETAKNAYYIVKYMGNNQETGINSGKSIDDPSATITTQNRLGLVNTQFLAKHYSSHNNTQQNSGSSLNDPAPTITTRVGASLVNAQFLDVIYGNGTPSSVEKPAPTVRTKDGLAIVNPTYIVNHQGQSKAMSIDNPSPTVLTKDKLQMVTPKYFIYKNYTSGPPHSSIDDPAGSVTTNPKMNLVKAEHFITDTQYGNIGSSIEEPAGTITANRKHHYLVNPQWGIQTASVDNPAFTIIARQDKAPAAMVTATTAFALGDKETSSVAIPVFETDTPIMIKIKEFMVIYDIWDIKVRMLMVPELLKIQSFPDNYYLKGSLTDKKKWIGNAVPPLVAQRIAEAMYGKLVDFIINELRIAA